MKLRRVVISILCALMVVGVTVGLIFTVISIRNATRETVEAFISSSYKIFAINSAAEYKSKAENIRNLYLSEEISKEEAKAKGDALISEISEELIENFDEYVKNDIKIVSSKGDQIYSGFLENINEDDEVDVKLDAIAYELGSFQEMEIEYMEYPEYLG